MTGEEQERLCGVALESVRGILPAESYRQAHDWIYRYGERLLALEHVIDWIGDLELTVDEDQLRAIEAAMSAMGQGDSARMHYLATLRS